MDVLSKHYNSEKLSLQPTVLAPRVFIRLIGSNLANPDKVKSVDKIYRSNTNELNKSLIQKKLIMYPFFLSTFYINVID
jgi:hypothetical protein